AANCAASCARSALPMPPQTAPEAGLHPIGRMFWLGSDFSGPNFFYSKLNHFLVLFVKNGQNVKIGGPAALWSIIFVKQVLAFYLLFGYA
ncbi:MAG: hypothetical protein RR281_06225, partial [Pseudoflavonifractor sp.]